MRTFLVGVDHKVIPGGVVEDNFGKLIDEHLSPLSLYEAE